MSAQFLQDYGEFIGRSGGRMVEDWAGVMAEALTNPWDAVAGINPFIDDDARYQAANRVMTGGRERAERTGHWLSGEYSQGALDIGESLGSRAQDLIQENDLASALVGTLEDPSLQLGLEMLPGVGGVLAKGGRIARRASQAEGAMERAFIKRNPDYLMDADTALPPGQKPLGQQMGGKQAGIIAGEKAIDNLKRSGADVMTSHGRKTGQELAEAMDAAKYMHSTGADPRDIWATTGMSLGTDDAWKWEIDDRQAVYNAPGTGVDPVQEMGPLVNVLNHPDLYKAYPKMEDIVADLDTSPGGTYYPNQFEFGREGLEDALVSKEWIQADRTSRDPRSLLLHEAQHGVQAREPGFDTGSNPTAAPPIYDEGLAESLDDWASTLASSGMDMDTMPGYVFNKNNMPMDGDDLEMTIFDQASWISKDMGWDTEAMYDAIDDHFGGGPLNTMVDSGYDSYMRSSGENEARTVQMRQDSSPAWRKEYPLDEGAPINREDRWMSEPGAREVSAWGGGGGGGNKPAKAPTYITTPTEYQKPAVPGEANRLVPKNRKVIPETLKTQFTGRGDDFRGITETEDGSKFAATDYSGVQCTGFACAVKHKLEPGRAEVFGFDEKSNPDAGVNVAAGGHDFAVVDNRYIVDPWLSEVESGNITTHKGEKLDVGGQVVFDMKKDQELIKQIYGDQDKWKQMEVPDRPFFDESAGSGLFESTQVGRPATRTGPGLPGHTLARVGLGREEAQTLREQGRESRGRRATQSQVEGPEGYGQERVHPVLRHQ